MLRGCLILILGGVLGAALMLHWWPHPPAGTVTPAASDISVTLSDGYLARAVQQQAAAQTVISLQRVQVTSSPPGDLIVRGTLSAVGVTAPATMDVRSTAQNGQLQVAIVTTEVAGIPLPPQVGALVSNAIDVSLQRAVGSNVTITGAAVTAQGLEIHADARGG